MMQLNILKKKRIEIKRLHKRNYLKQKKYGDVIVKRLNV